jgi:hypothetical protein
VTGTTTDDREKLAVLLQFRRKGETMVMTRAPPWPGWFAIGKALSPALADVVREREMRPLAGEPLSSRKLPLMWPARPNFQSMACWIPVHAQLCW